MMQKTPAAVLIMLCSSLFIFRLCYCTAQTGSSNFKYGLSERVRLKYWDNTITLNKSKDGTNKFSRFRTSFFMNWKPYETLELGLKITNEFRYYVKPKTDFNINEFFFDNLFIKYSQILSSPLSLTVGRQNIILGEGFVMMDGNPLDGSRSIYFNAVRADVAIDKNQNLTIFGTYEPVTDDILPVLNNRNQKLIEQPEMGIGVYYTGKHNGVGADAYVIRKNIEANDLYPISSKFTTAGMRIDYPVLSFLSLVSEAAFQLGNYSDFDRQAYGGYSHLDLTTGWYLPAPKKMTAGAIILSGDDPNTKNVEAWDPLFSRWPKWSESYIYTLAAEQGGKIAYWTNLISFYGSLEFKILEDISLEITYHHMLAQRPMSSASKYASGDGKTRGDLLILKVPYTLDKNLYGHFLLEHFWPGNFYWPGASMYSWFRFELFYLLST